MVPKQKEGGEKNQYKVITDRDEKQPTEVEDEFLMCLALTPATYSMIKNKRFKPLCAFSLLNRQQHSKLIQTSLTFVSACSITTLYIKAFCCDYVISCAWV